MSWPPSGKHQALEDDLEVEDEEPILAIARDRGLKEATFFPLG